MNKHHWSYTCVTLLLLLSACAGPSAKDGELLASAPPPPASPCEPPSLYALRALQWTSSARHDELERLDHSLDISEEYCSVLALAIFLSTPSGGFQDDNKAHYLLQKLHKDERLSKSEHDFVSGLLPHVEQRQNIRRLVDVLHKENQRLSNLLN